MMTKEKAIEIIATLERPTNPQEQWAEELLFTCSTTALDDYLPPDESIQLLNNFALFHKLAIANKELAQSYLTNLSKLTIEN